MNTRKEITDHLIGYVDEKFQTSDVMHTLGYLAENHFIETAVVYKANLPILLDIARKFDNRYHTDMVGVINEATSEKKE